MSVGAEKGLYFKRDVARGVLAGIALVELFDVALELPPLDHLSPFQRLIAMGVGVAGLLQVVDPVLRLHEPKQQS